jgi:tartrate-resistant acid phosphatase type 5
MIGASVQPLDHENCFFLLGGCGEMRDGRPITAFPDWKFIMSLIRTVGLLSLSLLASQPLLAIQDGAMPAKITTPPVVESAVTTGPSIDFIAVGDTGAETRWFSFFGSWYGVRGQHWAPGKSGLKTMAPLLQTYCKTSKCDFGVMLGDNIYPDGVDGEDADDDQERFDDVFIKPFTPLLENNPDFRIFPALGNHDWRGKRKGVQAQVDFLKTTPPFDMRGNFYSVKPKDTAGLVEVFVIDTEMLLSTQTVYAAHLTDDGNEARDSEDIKTAKAFTKPVTEAEKNQLGWLKGALKASTAQWKIVVGHHPLWSSGSSKFEQAHALRRILLPVLCGQADAYFAGHEHTLEVHADSCETVMPEGEAKPLLQVVSGAFAKSRLVHPGFKAYQDKTYPQLHSQYARGKNPAGSPQQYKQTWGFAHISLLGDKATIRILTHTEDAPKTDGLTEDARCVFQKGFGFGPQGCIAAETSQ